MFVKTEGTEAALVLCLRPLICNTAINSVNMMLTRLTRLGRFRDLYEFTGFAVVEVSGDGDLQGHHGTAPDAFHILGNL